MDDERVIKILNYFLNCILNSVATSKNQQNHGLFAKAKKKKKQKDTSKKRTLSEDAHRVSQTF